jgi:hypothetical protein
LVREYGPRLIQPTQKTARLISDVLGEERREMIEEKVKRDFFEIVDMHKSDDTASYWHGQSYEERIETIEFMRKAMFGHDRVSERLQRILTVAELKEN